jgi:hypothetical protein
MRGKKGGKKGKKGDRKKGDGTITSVQRLPLHEADGKLLG